MLTSWPHSAKHSSSHCSGVTLGYGRHHLCDGTVCVGVIRERRSTNYMSISAVNHHVLLLQSYNSSTLRFIGGFSNWKWGTCNQKKRKNLQRDLFYRNQTTRVTFVRELQPRWMRWLQCRRGEASQSCFVWGESPWLVHFLLLHPGPDQHMALYPLAPVGRWKGDADPGLVLNSWALHGNYSHTSSVCGTVSQRDSSPGVTAGELPHRKGLLSCHLSVRSLVTHLTWRVLVVTRSGRMRCCEHVFTSRCGCFPPDMILGLIPDSVKARRRFFKYN